MKKILKRVYKKIFAEKKEAANIERGENVGIKSSAVLVTHEGGKIKFAGDNYVGRNVEIGTSDCISFGRGTSIQDRSMVLGEVEVGEFCLIAPNVFISSGTHHYHYKPEFYIRDQDELIKDDKKSGEKSTKISIGDDCWIAINAIIMPGVTIGRGCIICASSIVTKDIEPFSVVAGEPARVIKSRLEFTPKISLSFDRDEDLPNFYKGFFLDLKNLKEDRKLGGIATSETFTLYLSTGYKRIKIQCKKLVANPIKISYNDETKEISGQDFETLVFDIGESNYHTFKVEKKDKNKYLLIKKIELTD